ncbi:Oidioi.mRNA.OKI2018_I69.chr2.g5795.t1.cds [Oikopleura dioica]|uniref:Oidioi.mRNA.OKI2018_I69.chr2.g5795.t1.cds n=1 Tax=Oikopleura dioica TaxID=34765 RepID=A0ABN7T1J1_OIKDI|nr:Oidioi.mRNA.OKI2018_I69.chr2.g5795.t1.cds [Oikopleura dioica]
MGNLFSEEVQPPPTPPPTQAPITEASLYLDFNKYGWVYIGGAIFLLVILAYSINKCCCKAKSDKHIESGTLYDPSLQPQMSYIQREQYLGPVRKSSNYSNGTLPSVKSGKAVQVHRELSLDIPNSSKLMLYNPQYAGKPIETPLYYDNSPASPYKSPLRYGSRSSLRSYRSMGRMKSYSNEEDSLIEPPSFISEDNAILAVDNEREPKRVYSTRSLSKSSRSMEQMVKEHIDEEVERRVKEELQRIIVGSSSNSTPKITEFS